MKTLYFECNMGAAGDMLMGALLELLPEQETFLEKLNHVGIPGIQVQAAKSVKCGITGTHVSVKFHGIEEESHDAGHCHEQEHHHSEEHCHSHEHHHGEEHVHTHGHSHCHAGMEDIFRIVDALDTEESVKTDIKNIYQIIAKAESQVHGKEISEIHFHEVGTADALADITGCTMLMHELGAERVIVSPIRTGFGQVRCAHGILPVPAPATALILQGIPCKSGNIEGELCTPTGAAILKYFATSFGRMPEMRMEKIGYGMGFKDFPAANCVRVIAGEA